MAFTSTSFFQLNRVVIMNHHSSTPMTLRDSLHARVLSHYQQYYHHKSIAAQHDVFHVFSPTWFTSFEKSFLWVAGFKPGLAFKLVSSSVTDLSEDQTRNINRLSVETRVKERILTEELAKIRESVVAPSLLEEVRVTTIRVPVDRKSLDGEVTIDGLKEAMELVLASADLLRMSTAEKVVDVLSPAQGVWFLTAATQFHLKIRSWGLQRDAKREANN